MNHYDMAVRLLTAADGWDNQDAAVAYARAQVHATLVLVDAVREQGGRLSAAQAAPEPPVARDPRLLALDPEVLDSLASIWDSSPNTRDMVTFRASGLAHRIEQITVAWRTA